MNTPRHHISIRAINGTLRYDGDVERTGTRDIIREHQLRATQLIKMWTADHQQIPDALPDMLIAILMAKTISELRTQRRRVQ
jgi:hypothetical protein